MPENAASISDVSNLYQSQYEVLRADSPALLDRVYQLRYQVYCIENRFENPDQNLRGRETDCDDNRAGHVLLIHRESGEAAGTARVIFP
jgi:N-acyl amino acid synthase of PEP-CTERM/exosortase system